jgi:uncharacterized protein YndB with AHSA1/START domain
MDDQPVVHSTFVIERTYPAAPERVFAAFADMELKRRWFAEGDSHDVDLFDMDFRVGGLERAEYRLNDSTPFPGVTIASEGTFLDIVPGRRVVSVSTMRFNKSRISAALVTVEVAPSDGGTDLVLTHQAAFFEGADGPQIRELGWRKLLDALGLALAG